jgi:DNA (cytosine-5)-methyltransferase 1
MKHIGLFEGIGGFSLAARWIGWETIAWCEWNKFGQKILKHHFPKANAHGDITKTDFTIYRGKCDILTGGFPCQPYSMAGKRKGKEDERHLWPEMLRAIREIQPRWIVGENVFGLVNWSRGLVFHEVQSEMEAEGYTVFPYVLPACAVNAPHRRDRVWFIAYSNGSGNNTTEGTTKSIRKQSDKEQPGSRGAMQINGLSNEQLITNTNSDGCKRSNGKHEINTGEGREYALNDTKQTIIADTESRGLQEWDAEQLGERKQNKDDKQLSGMGEWSNFPTEPPVYSRNDGLSYGLDTSAISVAKWRTESIKAYGNAIVPQVAYQIFKAIALMEVKMRICQPGDEVQCGVGKKIA